MVWLYRFPLSTRCLITQFTKYRCVINIIQYFCVLGQALVSFRTNIVNSDGVLLQWRPEDPDPCRWKGVTCDPKSKRVTSLWVYNWTLKLVLFMLACFHFTHCSTTVFAVVSFSRVSLQVYLVKAYVGNKYEKITCVDKEAVQHSIEKD